MEGQFEAGSDSLITINSFNAYRNTPSLLQGFDKLEYFNVDRVRPEKARTIEVGYRGTHWDKFYFDASAYSSWYTDFIGYVIGLSSNFDQTTGFPIGGVQVYRLAANATEQVRTQGVNLGVNYYAKKGDHVLVKDSFRLGKTGVPVLRGALTVFECKAWASYPGGDHVILVGEVEEMSTNANGKPLLFHAGRYGEIR